MSLETQSPMEVDDWEIHQPPSDLVFDDGEPLESNRHRIGMNALIRSMLTVMADRTDYFVGGNMFIYFNREQARNRDFRGPDFFVVLNVPSKETRQGWVVWEEQGRYPDVIIELMSPSTKNVDLVLKKELYQNTFKTRDYFVYDPFDPNSLQGWHLDNHFVYQPLTANENGWLWCETLGFWLGNWQGTLTRETATWLRFYDQQGNLVLLPEEAERQRANNERQRAEQAEKARKEAIPRLLQMGLNVEQISQALALTVEEVQEITETLT